MFQYKAQPDVPQKSEGVTPGHYALLRPDGMSFLSRCWRWRGRSLRRMARACALGGGVRAPEVQRFIEGVSGLSRHARLMSFGTASIEHGLLHDEDFGLFRARKHDLVVVRQRAGWGSPRGRPRARR